MAARRPRAESLGELRHSGRRTREEAKEFVGSANYSGKSPFSVACAAVFAAVKERLRRVSKRGFSERVGISFHTLAEIYRKLFKARAKGNGEAEEPEDGEKKTCRGQARLDSWLS